MAKFGRCPECQQLTLLAAMRRDMMGDLVAFIKCISCGYEDRKMIADSMELASPHDLDEDDDD